MKKFVFIAVFAASGLVFVSCDSDAIGSATPQFEKSSIEKKKNSSMASKEGDTIPTTNTVGGPGDDVIIITPPPRP
jgi:hypothetical protein